MWRHGVCECCTIELRHTRKEGGDTQALELCQFAGVANDEVSDEVRDAIIRWCERVKIRISVELSEVPF